MKNVMSVSNVVAWLKTKDPAGTYEYRPASRCLAGQYCREHGLVYRVPVIDDREGLKAGQGRFVQVLEMIAVAHPHTYGAALERAMVAERS